MKIINTLIPVLILTVSYGQTDKVFSRENVIGYKKIISRQTIYNNPDSSQSDLIYFINEIGDITRTESYEANKLTNWTKFEYNELGLLTYKESHSMTFRYDETRQEIGTITNDTYNARIFEYEDSLLAKIIYITSFEGSKSSHYVKNYQYDATGNLKTETSINGYIGLTGDFKPNSTNLDTMFVKRDVTTSLTTYRHTKDSIIATSFDENNEIQSYTFTLLNENKKPVHVLITNSKKESLQSFSTTYNDQGKVVTDTIKIIDAAKIEYDYAMGGVTQTSYNANGLPIERLTKKGSQIIIKQRIQYY